MCSPPSITLPPSFPFSLRLSLFLFSPLSLSLSLSLCLLSYPLSIFSGALNSNTLRRARIFSRLARSCIERARLATVSLGFVPFRFVQREREREGRERARETERERERERERSERERWAACAGGAACNLRSFIFICSLLF
jgi:hypothetical protein